VIGIVVLLSWFLFKCDIILFQEFVGIIEDGITNFAVCFELVAGDI